MCYFSMCQPAKGEVSFQLLSLEIMMGAGIRPSLSGARTIDIVRPLTESTITIVFLYFAGTRNRHEDLSFIRRDS